MTVFNLIMNKIIISVKELSDRYRMGQRSTIKKIWIEDNKDNLQRLLYRFQTTAENFNKQISVEKENQWLEQRILQDINKLYMSTSSTSVSKVHT